MSDPLTFMMGEFAALFPTDRHYAKNHMWAQLVEGVSIDKVSSGGGAAEGGTASGGRFRFGFAAYAVRLLQDVYFLDWHVEAGMTLSQGQEIGEIESSKAESSLYAPVAGRLVTINQTLLKDPSAINVDKYGAGWIFEIEIESVREGESDREGEAAEPQGATSDGTSSAFNHTAGQQRDDGASSGTHEATEGHDQTGSKIVREGEAPAEPHAHASVGMAPESHGATGSSPASASQDTPLPPTVLTPDEYIRHLDAVWAVTQRTIKGQLNE